MAVTESTLRADFPEFAATPSAVVTRSIETAGLHVSAAVFGDAYDTAVSYLACHFISRDPRGESTAQAYGGGGTVGISILKGDRTIRGSSRYRTAYESIRSTVIIPIFIA